jgi:spoIIIJ-associated protein
MSEPNEDEVVDAGWDSEDESDADDDNDNEDGGESSADSNGEDGAPRRARDDGAPYIGDERAEKALAFVAQVLEHMEMECSVRLRRPKPEEPNEIQLEIAGADSGRIIGKKGQVLGAFQYLTNRVVNRPGLERRYVTVDAEGYRSRRDSTLATMARRLGKQAVTEGKIITFEPMNPRDRRVIHLALAKFDGVVTKSEGEGDDRRVQIIPVRR